MGGPGWAGMPCPRRRPLPREEPPIPAGTPGPFVARVMI